MVFTKNVETKADLDAHALDSGASVSKGTKTFNTEKRKITKPKRLEKNPDAVQLPKPAPKPAPPPPPDPGLTALANQVGNASKVTAEILEGIREQLSRPQVGAAAPPIAWDFEFIRDDKGYLDRVRATAIFASKESLN